MNYSEEALQKVRDDRLLIHRYDEWLLEKTRPFIGQRILDVGCGMGNLSRYFQDKARYIGIDISDQCIERLQVYYRQYPGMSFQVMDVTDPALLGLVDQCLDTVISVNVFEHILEDETAIRQIYQVLQPSGYFLLIVPAHQFLYGNMDRAIGHYRRYTKKELAAKMSTAGFVVERQYYTNFVGAVGWFWAGRMMRRGVPPSGQLKLMNWIIPVLKKLESIVEPPMGVSLVSVARRMK